LKQQAVTEFLVAESERPASVHKRLLKAYGEVTVGVNTIGRLVRWIKGAEAGRGEIRGKPPATPDSFSWVNRYVAIISEQKMHFALPYPSAKAVSW
jgi:hypothetical protein